MNMKHIVSTLSLFLLLFALALSSTASASNQEYSISSIIVGTNDVTATVQAQGDCNFFAAIFNAIGKMLEVHAVSISGEEQSQTHSISFSESASNGNYVKAYLLDYNLKPLCNSVDSRNPPDLEPEPEPEENYSVLRGTLNYYSNVFASDGIVYFTFLSEPKIYAYDGSSTISFAAGGAAINLIVQGNTLYYLNNDNGAVYAIERTTGSRRILFNKETIYDFSICGNQMFMRAEGALYAMDLTSGLVKKIYENERITKQELSTDIKVLVNGSVKGVPITYRHYGVSDCAGYYTSWSEFYSERYSENIRTAYGKDCVLFLNTEITEAQIDSDESYRNANTLKAKILHLSDNMTEEIKLCTGTISRAKSGYKYIDYMTWYEYVENGDSVFLRANILNNSDYGETVTEVQKYYRIDFSTDMCMESTKEEYIENYGQWIFTDDVCKATALKGRCPATEEIETLMRSGNQLYLVGQSGGKVFVFEHSSPMLFVSGVGVKWLPVCFSTASLYMMDIDGNNPVELINYTQSGGITSSTGGTIADSGSLGPQICRVCGGAGTTQCLYCHGSGFGWHTTIGYGGGSSYGSCPNCGGSGKRICSSCHGTGQIYSS